ncbi:DUF6311 domain-containing protein [Rhizobium sp. FKY42]|uniref:DUF6311 domain-containing protein n=1 Tax=Rhizobium sp. FKY42 TaxID=2562310 RepID=UPI0010BF724B|nr:DUF6311 domain-containing protein [Rhizobium sp. FKY42]
MSRLSISGTPFPQIRQFLFFGLVGASSTAVHYIVALVLSQFVTLAWANPAGFMTAFLVSYFGHTHLTFGVEKMHRSHGSRLPRFALVAFAGFCLTQGIVMTLSSHSTLPNWLILAVALAVVPILTFLATKFWVFSVKGSTRQENTYQSAQIRAAVLAYGCASCLAVFFFFLTYPHPIGFLQGTSAYFDNGDVLQHVTGWLLFAKDAWRWPLLKTELINPPSGAHVALMDSIPLAALLFKPLQPWLPENFHYFGLWHLLNKLALACGAIFLLRSLRQRNLLIGLSGALLALLLPATIARLPHTALASQGLLLVALGLYFRAVRKERLERWHTIAFTGLNGALLLIHPYLLAMAFPIMLAAALDRMARYRDWQSALAMVACNLGFVASLALLLGYGGSPGDTNDTFRIFSMNLIGPLCGGALSFCSSVDATGGQYEGLNYLGAGVLLITLVAILRWDGKAFRRFLFTHPAFLLLLAGLTVYALSNHIYFGQREVASYPLFLPLKSLAETFRAPGRFFWPVGFSILFLSMAYGLKDRKIELALPLLTIAIGLQWLDTKPFRDANNAIFEIPKPFDYSVWKNFKPRFEAIAIDTPYGCNADVENMKYMYFQMVAARRAVPVNTAYLARSVNDCSIETTNRSLRPETLHVFFSHPKTETLAQEIDQGIADGSCMYWSGWKTTLCLRGARKEDWQSLHLF